MRNLIKYIFLFPVFVVGLLLCSCGDNGKEKCIENPKPSVYYWRTTLSLDNDELQFLKQNDIGKLYLHLFDVIRAGDGSLQPSGTLAFEDRIPDSIQVIPTIFIAPGALRDSVGVSQLPSLIWNRVEQMLTQNGYNAPSEIQIDYDWASKDAKSYFDFLANLNSLIKQEGAKLSVTIRLHQLAMEVPPVDYGVLMVYNVGDFKKESEKNSILTSDAIKPYLVHLGNYSLPLCVALPIFDLDLLFHDHDFQQIVRGVDLADNECFEKIDDSHYRCLKYMPAPTKGVIDVESQRILPGDVIRHEHCSTEELMLVKEMLESQRSGVCSQTILYHLDSKQIKQYENNEIKDLFTKS